MTTEVSELKITVPTAKVTTKAVIARSNRRLKENGETLRAARSERAPQDLGDFYLVNISINGVCDKYVDIEDLARQIGVLSSPGRRCRERPATVQEAEAVAEGQIHRAQSGLHRGRHPAGSRADVRAHDHR